MTQAWVTYGLGSENQNLPGYISMCPGGMPTRRTKNWQAAFLPSAYPGAYINTEDTRVEKLVEFIKNGSLDLKQQRRQLDLLLELNQKHLADRERDQQLEARVQSYELAYRMQMEASDAFDIMKEPEWVRQMYGDHAFGRQCLIARRLLERGVRFIQLWTGAGQPWDSHDEIMEHKKLANQTDGVDCGFEQLSSRIEMLKYDVPSTISNPPSQIISRHVYIKESSTGTAVRKFIGIKTHKTIDQLFAPYLLFFTDFRAGRKEPLQTEIKLASDEVSLMEILNKAIELHIKKGWTKV